MPLRDNPIHTLVRGGVIRDIKTRGIIAPAPVYDNPARTTSTESNRTNPIGILIAAAWRPRAPLRNGRRRDRSEILALANQKNALGGRGGWGEGRMLSD